MATDPALILIGYGNGTGLQLTVEADAMLRRHGFAFSLNAPPGLVRYLSGRHVEVEPLDDLLLGDKPWPERLLAVTDVVLRQAQVEQPVCLLLPDNPLFLNPLSRFLVTESRARSQEVLVIPGVSQFDIVINQLGLDVGRHGLAVLDAAQAIEAWPTPPSVPVLLFHLASVAETGDLGRLTTRLRSIYPESHPVTLVNIGIGEGGISRATFVLSKLEENAPHIAPGSCLFLSPPTTS